MHPNLCSDKANSVDVQLTRIVKLSFISGKHNNLVVITHIVVWLYLSNAPFLFIVRAHNFIYSNQNICTYQTAYQTSSITIYSANHIWAYFHSTRLFPFSYRHCWAPFTFPRNLYLLCIVECLAPTYKIVKHNKET